jgi:exopolyphosphatase/guanosine-5'-triphosphate,3'-diphosphate pyrophosphatase
MRLSVYSIHDHEIKPIFHRKSMSALISYVDKSGGMTERGISKMITVLLGFKKIIENVRIRNVYIFATASLRNIQNRQHVVDTVREATGFEVNVISGEEEGISSFVGAAYNVNIDSGLMVDIGGGSTELVFYQDRKISRAYSIPIGSLSLYANFVSGLVPTKDEYKKIKKYVKEQLEAIQVSEAPDVLLCGVGGTNRAACKLCNDYFDLPLNNRSLETEQIKTLMRSFYDEEDGVARILRVVPERIHTIIPGMIILRIIAKRYGCGTIAVSEYGVREGYLIRHVIGWENGEE